MYMDFSKSLQGSKSAMTMPPVSTESTLLLELPRWKIIYRNLSAKNSIKKKYI